MEWFDDSLKVRNNLYASHKIHESKFRLVSPIFFYSVYKNGRISKRVLQRWFLRHFSRRILVFEKFEKLQNWPRNIARKFGLHYFGWSLLFLSWLCQFSIFLDSIVIFFIWIFINFDWIEYFWGSWPCSRFLLGTFQLSLPIFNIFWLNCWLSRLDSHRFYTTISNICKFWRF